MHAPNGGQIPVMTFLAVKDHPHVSDSLYRGGAACVIFDTRQSTIGCIRETKAWPSIAKCGRRVKLWRITIERVAATMRCPSVT